MLGSNSTFDAYEPQKTLELNRSLKTPSATPVKNGKISLISTKENVIRDKVTDMNGDFKFTELNLSDTAKVILRARKANNGSNVAIYLKQVVYPAVIKQRVGDKITGLAPQPKAVMQKSYAHYRKKE